MKWLEYARKLFKYLKDNRNSRKKNTGKSTGIGFRRLSFYLKCYKLQKYN